MNTRMIDCRYGQMNVIVADKYLSNSLIKYGEWAQDEINLLLKLIDKGSVVLDVGAFIGTHALAFASRVGENGLVYCFEVQPTYFQILQENIERNHITNIKAKNVGLANKHEYVNIIAVDIEKESNYGEFTLRNLNTTTNNKAIEVLIMKLDELSLNKCDLIKLDVEGMERDVLESGRKLINKFRPFIYAECNSLEHGALIFEFLKETEYTAFLYLADAYNPQNFFGNAEDILSGAKEAGFIGIPSEKIDQIVKLYTEEHMPKIIPIETLDDLSLAMLKKPQYKFEILQNTKASKVIGIDFFRTEPELIQIEESIKQRNLQAEALRTDIVQKDGIIEQLGAELEAMTSQGEARTRQVDALNASLHDRDVEIAAIAVNLADKEEDIKKLTANLSVKEAENSVLAANLADREKDIGRLIANLATIEGSFSWKLICFNRKLADKAFPPNTARRRVLLLLLQAVKVIASKGIVGIVKALKNRFIKTWLQIFHGKGDAVTKDGPACDPLLFYNIDELLNKGTWIYGWGWLFHQNRTVSSLDILTVTDGVEHRYPCRYGLRRPDVREQFLTSNSENAGFMVSCRLPSANVSDLILEACFTDGGSLGIRLNNMVSIERDVHKRRIALMHRWIGHIRSHIKNRDFRGLSSKIKTKTREIQKYSGMQKTSQEQLQHFLDSKLPRYKHVFIIDHNLGGGANLYRDRLIEKIKGEGKRVLLLYFVLSQLDYHIHYIDRENDSFFIIDSMERLVDIISNTEIEEIYLSNLFSFDDPLAMVAMLLEVKKRTAARLIIPIHDYFSICPSWTLLDDQGRFCGIPNMERCRQCLPVNHGDFSFLVDCKDIDIWRRIWGDCLQEATSIICFSQSSKDLICRAYPELNQNKIEIRPHTVDYLAKHNVRLSYGDTLNVGILGRIDEHKGAGMVREMVRIIEERILPMKIIVIGDMDSAPPSSALKITGSYNREELPQVIEKSGANLLFLPSIWPETFSYVVEEIMQLGLPLAVFNLGAPAERVAKYQNGLIISQIDAETAINELLAFGERLRKIEMSSLDSQRFSWTVQQPDPKNIFIGG